MLQKRSCPSEEPARRQESTGHAQSHKSTPRKYLLRGCHLGLWLSLLKELVRNTGAERTATIQPYWTGPELVPSLAKAQQSHISSPTAPGDAGAAPALHPAASPVFPEKAPLPAASLSGVTKRQAGSHLRWPPEPCGALLPSSAAASPGKGLRAWQPAASPAAGPAVPRGTQQDAPPSSLGSYLQQSPPAPSLGACTSPAPGCCPYSDSG